MFKEYNADMKIVITGGHHSSALPVIKELKNKSPDCEIIWFGHKYSMVGDKNVTLEFREITDLNIPFYHIHAGKVYKTLNLKRLLKVPYGFFHSLYLLNKIKPDVILSFGGYIAVPVVIAGWVLGIPSVTHEQTVVAGYANKVISIFAKRIMVSWKSSEEYFPKNKTVYTAIPLRSEIFEIKSNTFGVNESLPTIYVTAGKTGSVKINEIIKSGLKEFLNITNIIHQCGDHSEYEYYDQLIDEYEKIKDQVPGKYFVRKFIFSDEIGEAYSKADVVISRSGAHTTAELSALGKKAVLIPIPWVSHNEQYENAKILKDDCLATIVDEKNLNKDVLLEAVKEQLNHQVNIQDLKQDIYLNAGKMIANEVLSIVSPAL